MNNHLAGGRFPPSMTKMITLCALLAAIPGSMPGKPLDIGTHNQIFIEVRFLAERKNVRIVVQQPRKTGEMMAFVSAEYLQVMEYDGVFKYFTLVSHDRAKWENTTNNNPRNHTNNLALAVSLPLLHRCPPSRLYDPPSFHTE